MKLSVQRGIMHVLQLDSIAPTPGSTGIRLMEATIPGKAWRRLMYQDTLGTLVVDHNPRNPFLINPARDLAFGVPSDSDALYDKVNAYLATCSSISLPLGPYEWVEEYRGQPGLWQVPKLSRASLPSTLPAEFVTKTGTLTEWMYTPTIRFLTSQGYHPLITGGYAFKESWAALVKWYRRIREALQWSAEQPEHQEIRQYLKDLYCQAIAFLATPPAHDWQVYRPDWRELIRDETRARILYTVAAVYREHQALPTAAKVDCLAYRSEVLLKIGTTPGSWKLTHKSIGDSQWAQEVYNDLF